MLSHNKNPSDRIVERGIPFSVDHGTQLKPSTQAERVAQAIRDTSFLHDVVDPDPQPVNVRTRFKLLDRMLPGNKWSNK